MRVAVAPDEQAVRRCGVQRPPVLFRVLAVVALAVGDAVEALLQDRVTLVPQGHREAQVLPAVAEPREPVLAPAVGAGVGVLEREAPPGVTVGAVVLAHGAPLPQRQVGAPAPPVRRASTFLGQPRTLGLGLIRAPPRPPRRCRPVVAPPGPRRHGRASCQTATPCLESSAREVTRAAPRGRQPSSIRAGAAASASVVRAVDCRLRSPSSFPYSARTNLAVRRERLEWTRSRDVAQPGERAAFGVRRPRVRIPPSRPRGRGVPRDSATSWQVERECTHHIRSRFGRIGGR